MVNAILRKLSLPAKGRITHYAPKEPNNLAEATVNLEYFIKDVITKDEAMKQFLFTLGCYQGEPVTVISVLADHYVISVKDARYSIDKDLAESIIL